MTDAKPPFILDLTATSGPAAAELSATEDPRQLHQWMSWMRIRSDISGFLPPTYNPADDELTGFVPPAFEEDGLALLAIARSFEDLPGEAIGLFHARLEPADLDALRDAVEGTDWLNLPAPVGGDFNAPTLTLTYESGTRRISRSFNARSRNFFEAIAPLWRLVDRAAVRAGKTAASSWRLELEAAPEPELAPELVMTIKLRLRARGIGHLVINDPRLATEPGERPRLRVLVGEHDPGCPEAAPSRVVEVPIPSLAEHEPKTLLIRPNGRFELSVPWRVARPGHYHVQAMWQDYGGPVEPAAGQTPFMPIGKTGPSHLGSGPYPVAGAVFAEQIIEMIQPD